MDNTTLTHHGIKGMRWGIRRYQNKDGTLTAAGKKKYNAELEKIKAREKAVKNYKRTQAKFDKLEAKRKELDEEEKLIREQEEQGKNRKDLSRSMSKNGSPKKNKSVKDMSDDELREVISRLDLEKRYSDLVKTTTPQTSGKGRKFVEDVVTSAGSNIAKQAVAYMMGRGVNKLFKDIFDENIVDPKNIQKKK